MLQLKTLSRVRRSVSIGQVSSAAIRWSQVQEEKVNIVNGSKG